MITRQELINQIEDYKPFNEQEKMDKLLLLNWIRNNDNAFSRENTVAHMTASAWVKPKEKGKQPFSAYLRWDADNKKIGFEFPGVEERREQSNYSCPICFKKMYKGTNSYYCGECGFSLHTTISSVNIPEEQIKKLLVYGRTDVISGFFSPTKRKLFSARLCIDKSTNKVAFSFLDMHKGGISDES